MYLPLFPITKQLFDYWFITKNGDNRNITPPRLPFNLKCHSQTQQTIKIKRILKGVFNSILKLKCDKCYKKKNCGDLFMECKNYILK